jgi:cytoskeletal protein RodZ
LRALEKGDLKPFYNSKFHEQAALRYARLLGVNIEEVNAEAPEVESVHNEPADPEPSIGPQEISETQTPVHSERREHAHRNAGDRSQRARRPVVAALTLAVLIVGFLGLSLFQSKPGPPANESAQVSPPTQGPVDPVASSPASSPSLSPPPTQGLLQSTEATWAQVVFKSGEKQNRRLAPGEPIEFNPNLVVSLAFGKPEQAKLTIRGKNIPIEPHVLSETPSRAIVIVRDALEQ